MFSGMAAQFTATKAGLRARARAMDESRQHFLAGAGFADDQHGAVGGGDAAREIQDQSRRRIDRDRFQGVAQAHFGAHLKPQLIRPKAANDCSCKSCARPIA